MYVHMKLCVYVCIYNMYVRMDGGNMEHDFEPPQPTTLPPILKS